jgi:hypothetical protein
MSSHLGTLFTKSIGRPIEGVIKADDESDLLTEVGEYVITKEVAKRLDVLLEAYIAGGSANGVWIAGFFGSGKSHLLKILSLLLEDRTLGASRVSDLFLPKLDEDPMLQADLKKALKIPSRSVRFNIDQKADLIAKDQLDALLAVFVKVFNELRGYYPKQGYIAELESELDDRKLLAPFKEAYQKECGGRTWEADRDIVHTLENETFARAYSSVTKTAYEEALKILDRKHDTYKVSIESFAESVKRWLDQQPTGFRLNFFVDEVGQFIGTNSKLMLNLQTLAESLATRCQGRAWIFVTSQGDLATVLGELGTSAGNDFTKIQGRFKTLLNLTSQDVAEVICKRLLDKTPTKPDALTRLYSAEAANLKTLFKFGDESRDYRGFADEDEFCAFYPFHPYQFELLQAALITLSKHNFFTGKAKSIGERSMLGILQDVGKGIAAAPIGQLATFDAMFEGLRGGLRGDLQTAIQTAERNLGDASSLPVRLLKALFLLKYVNEFKATPRNLAILLIERCHVDIAAHEKAVREALVKLENDTYIQRNGEAYEFLTDDEKDVETEIKGTDVDESEVSELLARIAYDDILRETKLRYEDNKQDYPFTRRLDGQTWGKREYDLALHIASDLHESYGDPVALANQSMGKAELLLVLPSDPRLIDDLRLFLKTDKYYRQNYSATLPEARARILRERQQTNNESLRPSLEARLKEALCAARMVLNGSDLTNASSDPRTRIAKGFQDLVRLAFPSLRMLRRQFSESDLQTVLSTPADDFFKSDDGTLGEAEQEILLRLQLERAKGTRVSVSDLLSGFEKRPYGWPLIATQCLIARLFMRGRVELRQNGSLLDAAEAYPALSNNRQFAQTIVTLQEQFDAAAVAKLKQFHRDFFDQANPGTDAKDVATAFQRQIEGEAVELEKLASHSDRYPFFAALTPVAAELRALAGREWSHCLKELPGFKDQLLDAKDQTIDPLKQFYKGAKRQIYDDIVSCLRSEEPNIAGVSGNEFVELTQLVASATPYKGNALQQAKAKLDVLKAGVATVLAEARARAIEAIGQAEAAVRGHHDFGSLSTDEQQAVLAPFAEAKTAANGARLVPVLQQTVNRAAQELMPAQMQRVSELVQVKRPKAEGVREEAPPSPVYVAAQKIPVSFAKRVLESDADLDGYLAAVRSAYSAELQASKRITL